jgi:2-amino-4-hydroxy-6-hydroxymethyldihydropteridine diphosphokinase
VDGGDAQGSGAAGMDDRRESRRAFVALGSNLGDRAAYLARARDALAALPGTAVIAASRVYETAPQDVTDQPPFLNQVVCLETGVAPLDLLRACQAIETANGRVRERRFGARTLDIDILVYEGVETDDPELTLPHPRLAKRAFVLAPLTEIWGCARGMPDLDVGGLAAALARDQAVRPYDGGEA